jgi:hypothetical protein
MQRSRKVLVVLCAVLLIGSLAAAGTAVAGTWYSARHGQFDWNDVAGIDAGGPSELWGGMDFRLNPNSTVRVLYSIPGSTYDWPVFFQHKVRWVRVNARLWSADTRVVAVRVRDGDVDIGGVSWGYDGGWKNAYHDIYVDLGADKEIKKGLGIVVTVQSGATPFFTTIQAVSARVD